MDGHAPAETTTPILIIGCGFGGLAMAIALKKAGIHDFTIVERASDVGGVWRDNTYPGAACDVVSRLYSFSYDQSHDWSTAFAPQGEILTYLKGCVAKHDVMRHITFNTAVSDAAFDEATATWTVHTNQGTYRTPVLVSAVGLFNQPAIPTLPGRETFQGKQFHSARWDHSFSLQGRTVAVVGNGASAVQFVPKVAAQAGRLSLFIRSPQYVMPKTIFPGTGKWDAWLQKHPRLRWLARLKIYLMFERFIFRRSFFPEMRKQGEAAFRALLERKVRDPELRRKLTPDYAMGCKRLLVSDEWFDTLVKPHVDVVFDPIERIEPDGIRTRDGGFRKVDAIIYGTGFTPSDFLTPMKITGLGGRDLNEVWRDGAEAYLGIAVPAFPNFFMLYGPNTNAITSIIFMLECQAHYIVEAVRTLRRSGRAWMTVRSARHRSFNEEVAARLSRTVPAMANCHTYFKQENGRLTTNWPGYATEYRLRTHRVSQADYEFGDARVRVEVQGKVAAD